MTALAKLPQSQTKPQPFRPSKLALLAMVLAMQPLVWTAALMGAFYMLRFGISRRMLRAASHDFHLYRQWWYVDILFACSVSAAILAIVALFSGARKLPEGRPRGASLCCAVMALFLGIVSGVFLTGNKAFWTQ